MAEKESPLTLDEFLKNDMDRAWVLEEGFSSLYVRKGCRYINGKFYQNVFDISSITAENPGEGAFKKLIEKLTAEWKGPIYVENVLTTRFATSLLHSGFVPAKIPGAGEDELIPRCFVYRLEVGEEAERPTRRGVW